MADKKKSILEEAILDAKRIQEALNANTKEILRSVAKEEIESLVKESLEEDYLEEDVDDTEEIEAVDSEEAGEEIELDSVEGEDEAGEEEAGEDEEGEIEVGDIESSEVGDDLEGDYETGMDAIASDDEIEMDMTTASDEDVIAVYKKLTGDDEIEVVVDDEKGEVKLTVNEPGEFVIKTDGAGEVEGGEEVEDLEIDPVGDSLEMDTDSDDAEEIEDEVMYEIALDEETKIGATANGKPRTATSDVESSMGGEIATGDIEGQKAPEGNENDDNWAGDNLEGGFTEEDPNGSKDGHAEHIMNEEEIAEEEVAEGDEAIEEKIQVGKGRTVANNKTEIQGAGGDANNVKAPNVTAMSEGEKKYKALLAEATELKGKTEEYKEALKKMRTMLAETVVFNSNLTYVTKLMMEHSTTKSEKEAIFRRFDNEVSTLKESKKLYKTIASELSARKPINEAINNKIDKEVTSSVSKQLNESTAYIDKETSRIMDLMKRVEQK